MTDIGFKKNLRYGEYSSFDGVRYGTLIAMDECPKLARHRELMPEHEPTDALILGQAMHYRILQPEYYLSAVAVAPEINRRTNAGKAEWEEFQQANADKVILKPDQAETVEAMGQEVWKLKTVDKLLSGAECEVSLLWEDKDTGVRCKGRPDAYREDLGCVIDLKTTRGAGRYNFMKSIAQYGYHRQAAWYMEGLKALGKKAEIFVFIAVEKEAPYLCAVYQLKQSAIDIGMTKNRESLRKYQACSQANYWPGYTDMVDVIDLPEWAQKQEEQTYG